MFEPVVMSPVPGQNASVTNFFPAQLAGIHDIGNSVVLGSKNFRGSTVAVIAASLVPAIRTAASCVYISSFRGQLQVQVHWQGPRPVAGARADFVCTCSLGGGNWQYSCSQLLRLSVGICMAAGAHYI